jgi:hypothetical protein
MMERSNRPTVRALKARRILLLIAAVGASCLALISCATTYGAIGNNGGYRDFQESKTRYHVYFLANSDTPRDTAYRFFLARAAQIALHRGYKYFYVYHLKDSSQSQVSITPGLARTYVYRDFEPGYFWPYGFLDPSVVQRSITIYTPPVYNRIEEPGYQGQVLLVNHRLKGQPLPFDAQILYREGMSLNRRIKMQNLKAGIAVGIGTVVIIGVATIAAFLGSGGTIAFGHVTS